MTEPILTYALIAVNAYVSYLGFTRFGFMNRFQFETGPILGGDYQRMVTSGFLHVDGHHLFFNMIALYMFGQQLELSCGPLAYGLLYLFSLLGGSALSLLMHRHHYDYCAVGASGAVSGLVFAAVFLMPGMGVGLIFLPIFIPGWLFAIIYTGISIWGIKKKWGNIGHDAHLGGAIVGMLGALAIDYKIVLGQWPLFLTILGLFCAFLISYWYNPFGLEETSASSITIGKLKKLTSKAPRTKMANETKVEDSEGKRIREEMDVLLAKITDVGLDGLTPQERERLEVISKKLREED
ncbi:MAG: rhomboid family intramembrane serine protease [Planctomycetota bacterium]|nr:rhomboid family intramembrane serine protease [Planctomycetota bacterium]